MNKMIDFAKKYWYLSLFIIPIIFSLTVNNQPDNDFWWIYNHGRYVINNHIIPTTEPFTIHENMNFIMQQWLSACIYYLLTTIFGLKSLGLIVTMLLIPFMYLYYKLIKELTNNKIISIIATIVVAILIKKFWITRPQIFTYFILLLETYLLEKYINSKNKRYLYPLPFLSILEINLHASMWMFQFIFMLPFIVNGIKIKKFKLGEYKVLPIITVALIMIVLGIVNPYGINAILYTIKGYNVPVVNANIAEMKPINFNVFNMKVITLIIAAVIFMLIYNKKAKIELRYYLFFIGTLILTFMHNKCYPYFIIYSIIILAFLFNNLKYNKVYDFINKYINKNILKISKVIFIIILIFLNITLIFSIYTNVTLYKDKLILERITKYMDENYNKEEIRLFTSYNDGGYFEYKGFKCYMDARAEVFVSKINGKEDIINETFEITKEYVEEEKIKDFLNKYNFTHFFIETDTIALYRYLKNSEEYELVFTLYDDDHQYQEIDENEEIEEYGYLFVKNIYK